MDKYHIQNKEDTMSINIKYEFETTDLQKDKELMTIFESYSFLALDSFFILFFEELKNNRVELSKSYYVNDNKSFEEMMKKIRHTKTFSKILNTRKPHQVYPNFVGEIFMYMYPKKLRIPTTPAQTACKLRYVIRSNKPIRSIYDPNACFGDIIFSEGLVQTTHSRYTDQINGNMWHYCTMNAHYHALRVFAFKKEKVDLMTFTLTNDNVKHDANFIQQAQKYAKSVLIVHPDSFEHTDNYKTLLDHFNLINVCLLSKGSHALYGNLSHMKASYLQSKTLWDEADER